MSTGKDTPVPMIADPLAEFASASDEKIDVIADRYVVTQLLGQGGMGRVFRAHDKLLLRDVAVKLLNRELRDDYFIRRFQQEARAASQLNHTNILCVLDFGLVSQTQPYLVMEWVDGLTLDQHMERKGRFSIRHAIEVCQRLTDAMQHAHRNGIVHRDLKPSNIMLSHSELGERVLILDFGIAKMVDAPAESGMLTMTGQIIGSPRCISPEQARGESLDGRSDIYSLGCVMFEMFTGKPPYRGDSAIATIAMHLNEPIPAISEESDPKFPEGLEAIIQKAMAKSPGDRFATMEELGNQLRELNLDSIVEEVEEPPVEIIEPKVKPRGTKFNTKAALAIASIILVASATFIILATRISSNDANQEKLKPSPAALKATQEQFDESSPLVNSAIDDKVVGNEFHKTFQLNRGLGENDMIIVNSAKSGADLQTAINAQKHAYHLRMYQMTITSDMVDAIEKSPHIRELRLQSCVVSPELQIRICKLKNLVILKFVNIPITAAAIKQCASLPKLTDLQIYSGNLDDEAVTAFSELTNLEVAEIKDNKLSPRARVKLAALKKLKKFQLDSCGIEDSDLKWISELDRLELLTLSNNGPFTPKGLKQLTKLKHLQNLYLDNTNLDSMSLMLISKISSLRVLDISKNKAVTIGGLQHLAWRPELTVVVFDTGIGKNNLETLSKDLNTKLMDSRPTPGSSSKVMDFLLPGG